VHTSVTLQEDGVANGHRTMLFAAFVASDRPVSTLVASLELDAVFAPGSEGRSWRECVRIDGEVHAVAVSPGQDRLACSPTLVMHGWGRRVQNKMEVGQHIALLPLSLGHCRLPLPFALLSHPLRTVVKRWLHPKSAPLGDRE